MAMMTLGCLLPRIRSSITCLNSTELSSRRNPAAFNMFETILTTYKHPPGRSQALITLLRTSHFLDATKDIDRVYALLALAKDEDRVLVPDYSISNAQMLRVLVPHLILTDNNLTILSGNKSPAQNPTDDCFFMDTTSPENHQIYKERLGT